MKTKGPCGSVNTQKNKNGALNNPAGFLNQRAAPQSNDANVVDGAIFIDEQ